MRTCALLGLYALLIVACYGDATVGQLTEQPLSGALNADAGERRVTRQIIGGYPYYGAYGGGIGGFGFGRGTYNPYGYGSAGYYRPYGYGYNTGYPYGNYGGSYGAYGGGFGNYGGNYGGIGGGFGNYGAFY